MKSSLKGICTKFAAKTSNTGNLYYQVDITETIETGNPDEPKKDITFKDLYLNIGKPIENHGSFVGRQVEADISIFPSDRRVGERVYQDIKLKLDHIVII